MYGLVKGSREYFIGLVLKWKLKVKWEVCELVLVVSYYGVLGDGEFFFI